MRALNFTAETVFTLIALCATCGVIAVAVYVLTAALNLIPGL